VKIHVAFDLQSKQVVKLEVTDEVERICRLWETMAGGSFFLKL